jgi:hypothetical protein
MTNFRKLTISRTLLVLLPFLILPINKNFWFHSDDWFWFRNYPNFTLNLLDTYSGLHFILIPELLFNTIIKIYGVDSFIYFELLLMLVNALILLTAFEIVRSKTNLSYWIIVYSLSFWYTNPWGRENIRWPIAVSTNLSLLFTLLLIFLLIRQVKFPSVIVFLLLAASFFSSSWGFAYIPFIIGTVLDSKYSLNQKKLLITSIVAESLIIAFLLFQTMNGNFNEQDLNIIKLIVITLSAPIVSLIAYSPYFFSWTAILQVAIFVYILFKLGKNTRLTAIRFNIIFSYKLLGIVLSILAFGFSVALGRDSSNLFILLSSRFVFVLSFLFVLAMLLGSQVVPNNLKVTNRHKMLMGSLLLVNFVSLASALNTDINREKWERIEFMKLVDSRKTESNQTIPLNSCCNMDPSISPQVLRRLLNDA